MRKRNDIRHFFAGCVIIGAWLSGGCAAFEEQRRIVSQDDVLRVHAGVTVNDVKHHPIGINLNYLMDDDSLLNPNKGIVDSLQSLGVKYLRYPGGEKSDSYLWTVPPWPNSPKEELHPMLARTGPYEWPSNTRFTLADMSTLIPEVLDFKEFMSICMAVQCEPVIVVAADSPYVPPSESGTVPTRQALIESAAEWVRYANVTMDYAIKYWMIGNESFGIGFNGGTDAETYARDLIDYSIAMRAVDPSIKIIANGDGSQWWKVILNTASEHIDYLGVSHYPVYDWSDFETYQRYEIELDRAVKHAISAIEQYAPLPDAHRLEVVVCEINVVDWSEGGWKNRNDLGHALVLFQMIGDLLMQERVAFIQYWTTRWVEEEGWEFPRVYDAIDQNGRLQATGMALAIWGEDLLDSMVSTVGTKWVKVYATFSEKSQQLTVFLLNKDRISRAVSLDIFGHDSVGIMEVRSLSGTGPNDVNPHWRCGKGELVDQRLKVTLPAVSITVMEIQGNAEKWK